MACWIIHYRVVLRRCVVPDGNTVGLPAPTHLVFRNARLTDQITQQFPTARVCVLPKTDMFCGVKIGEVRCEDIHIQHLLSGFWMRSHDWMLCIRVLRFERQTLFHRHRCTKGGFDTVASP
ncbi:hypothetical protein D3C80_1852630 [compost metagenome]